MTARAWSQSGTWWCTLPDLPPPCEQRAYVEDDAGLDIGSREVRELLGEGDRAVREFAVLLADHGVVRGLIGPREVPRLWARHVLNCAAVGRLLPEQGVVVDVGSGGGLPGIVLAAMRPQAEVVLVEAMERRVVWLEEVVRELGLENTRVLRGRAEELGEAVVGDVVTARAVAPLDRLAGWTLPLLKAGGELLAMKGRSAREEIASAEPVLSEYGGGRAEVLTIDVGLGVEPTTVVRVRRESERVPARMNKTRRRQK